MVSPLTVQVANPLCTAPHLRHKSCVMSDEPGPLQGRLMRAETTTTTLPSQQVAGRSRTTGDRGLPFVCSSPGLLGSFTLGLAFKFLLVCLTRGRKTQLPARGLPVFSHLHFTSPPSFISTSSSALHPLCSLGSCVPSRNCSPLSLRGTSQRQIRHRSTWGTLGRTIDHDPADFLACELSRPSARATTEIPRLGTLSSACANSHAPLSDQTRPASPRTLRYSCAIHSFR